MAAEDLLRLPVFKEVSPQFLKKNANATVWRHFKRGDIVCREGEFGSTAFYILEGKASVALASSDRARESARRPGRIFSAALTSKLTSRLAARQEDRREEEADRRSIPIDAPVDLAYDHPVAELAAGRTVRRNDLHELLSALCDGAR